MAIKDLASALRRLGSKHAFAGRTILGGAFSQPSISTETSSATSARETPDLVRRVDLPIDRRATT